MSRVSGSTGGCLSMLLMSDASARLSDASEVIRGVVARTIKLVAATTKVRGVCREVKVCEWLELT
jgi:hypothetical protein